MGRFVNILLKVSIKATFDVNQKHLVISTLEIATVLFKNQAVKSNLTVA